MEQSRFSCFPKALLLRCSSMTLWHAIQRAAQHYPDALNQSFAEVLRLEVENRQLRAEIVRCYERESAYVATIFREFGRAERAAAMNDQLLDLLCLFPLREAS